VRGMAVAVWVQRREEPTGAVARRVTNTAPTSIGSQKLDNTESERAMMEIHAKIKNRNFALMGWITVS